MAKKGRSSSPVVLLQGTVIRSVGSSIRVLTAEGTQVDCIVKGKFRIQGLNTTNPVAVGDEVRFFVPNEGELGVIQTILPRRNYMLRKAISHARRVHILCANIDQAVLLFTVDHPVTSTGFANRFLLITEAYDIPALILINKIDLLASAEQKARLAEIEDIYTRAGFPVTSLSAIEPGAQATVEALLAGKRSFIGGHSGAGKSTLINLIDPQLDLKTAEISSSSNKGQHATTYAEMYPLAVGGAIIDSPGIKEFGLAGFTSHEISHFFPEMRALLPNCRFHNCLHRNEPGCAVKAGLETGAVHASRYDSYLRMLEEIEAENPY